MTDSETSADCTEHEKVVPVSVLEGLVEGWRSKVTRHDFDGSADEYRGFMEAHESCADDIETVIRHSARVENKLNSERERAGGPRMSYLRFQDGQYTDLECVYLFATTYGGLQYQSPIMQHYRREPFIEAVMQVMSRGDFSQEELNRMHAHLLEEIPEGQE